MTTKNELFIAEYLNTWNATQAAISAGYSEATAYSIGWELLRKPEIKVALDAKIEELLGGRYKAIHDSLNFWQGMRDDPEAGEAARIKASELYAKYFELFTERVKVEHDVSEEAYERLKKLYK